MLRLASITFDCADPRRLAEFWSQATGYTVKDANEFFAALMPPAEGGPRRHAHRVRHQLDDAAGSAGRRAVRRAAARLSA